MGGPTAAPSLCFPAMLLYVDPVRDYTTFFCADTGSRPYSAMEVSGTGTIAPDSTDVTTVT